MDIGIHYSSILVSFILGFIIVSLFYFFSPSSSSSSSFHNCLTIKFRKLSTILIPSSSCSTIASLISFYKNRHRLLNWYTDLLSQSPTQTIVLHRLGAPRTIITANPDNVEYILKTNFANYPKGKPFTELLGDFLGRGIFNVDGHAWSVQRKLASHEFSTKSLREFVVKILQDEVENRLIPTLETAADSGRILDMQEVLRRFAFDTICKLSIGMDPCCLNLSRPPPKLAEAFDAASGISAMRGTAPVFVIWKLKRAFNLGLEKELKEAVKLVHSCVDEMIRLKKESVMDENNGGDLLSRFLEAGIDEEIVRDMVISFLMAGRDTTSAAVTWLFWLLTGHREIEKQAVDEIRSIQNENGRLNFDDLKEMNFTTACLNESMRLYPPVVWDSKHAATDDILPDGTAVRRGNRVTYFQYGMGRMEELWGKERLEFRPERWLEENGAVKKVSPFKFAVFQAGPRVCLGKEMAYTQMKYLVASVLGKYEMVRVRAEAPVFVPLLTAHMAGGFNIRVRRRSN